MVVRGSQASWTNIRYTFWAKMASFREAFLGKRFVCCALTIVYSIYNMAGRSIASISDLGGIFTEALCASVNMSPQVVYIGYGPPYRTIYITYSGALHCLGFINITTCILLQINYIYIYIYIYIYM